GRGDPAAPAPEAPGRGRQRQSGPSLPNPSFHRWGRGRGWGGGGRLGILGGLGGRDGEGGDLRVDLGRAGEQALLRLRRGGGRLAGRAGGEVVAQRLRFPLVEEAVQVVEPQVRALITGVHGGHLSLSTRRSFCNAARIWVLTVPTGLRRNSAISS